MKAEKFLAVLIVVFSVFSIVPLAVQTQLQSVGGFSLDEDLSIRLCQKNSFGIDLSPCGNHEIHS